VTVDRVDVLIIAALKMEHDAAKVHLKEWIPPNYRDKNPYGRGVFQRTDGSRLAVALAHAPRMSGRHVGPVATALSAGLRPSCLAMSGVCAGNPSEVALGDVVVAETTYEYDEGKQTADDFLADHRQYQLDSRWIRAAQDLDPSRLDSFGPAGEDETAIWLLERLYLGQEPTKHPAFHRYFPARTWEPPTETIAYDGLIARDHPGWALTVAGREYIERVRYNDVDGPEKLPLAVVVAPMASGSYVAKDGASWERLRRLGVRTVTGLEMESATIATVAEAERVPYWLVVKGVMDHADPNKDDRYKQFAARASAEVLYALLDRLVDPASTSEATAAPETGRYKINMTGVQGAQIGDHNIQTNTFHR
jgi:nucleoside phosphorylase